jgi:ethanolamine-phosphate cytidylyltransferase
MEDILKSLSNEEITEFLYINLIEKSKKLKNLKDRLIKNPTSTLTPEFKEKLSSCESAAKKKFSDFNDKIEKQLSNVKPVRIYMDGVFDIIHSGHFNAFRQAQYLGDILVCGLNSDADVAKAKGKTLMDIKERSTLAGASKWIGELALDTPYTPTVETLDTYNCDYLAHGDDIPTNEHGNTIYDEIIAKKRLRVFRRTEGISTTVIIGRLLLGMKDKFDALDEKDENNLKIKKSYEDLEKASNLQFGTMTTLLTTSYRIADFSNKKMPNPGDKVVYICGEFDVLHMTHIEALKKAKESGDFVYVGVYDDITVNKRKGKYNPVLNINERCLNLLALKYVDDVVFGAPEIITQDLIHNLNVDVVIQFITPKMKEGKCDKEEKIFEAAKKVGKLKEIEINGELSNDVLSEKIWENKEQYISKYIKKSAKVDDHIKINGQEVQHI